MFAVIDFWFFLIGFRVWREKAWGIVFRADSLIWKAVEEFYFLPILNSIISLVLANILLKQLNSITFFSDNQCFRVVLDHLGPLLAKFSPFEIILDLLLQLHISFKPFGPFRSPVKLVLDRIQLFWTNLSPFLTVSHQLFLAILDGVMDHY